MGIGLRGEYEPIFIIEIEGEELPPAMVKNITNFSYEDHEDKLDELKFTIEDKSMEYIDHPLLQKECIVRVRWGYIGAMSDIRVCVIKEIGYTFPENGAPKIEIRAFDQGVRLTGRSSRKCWSNVTGADVIRDIASKHNLTPVIEMPDDFPMEQVSQGGKSDMEFVKEIATERGCKAWVTNDELHAAPFKLGESGLTVSYRSDKNGYLLSLTIKDHGEDGKGARAETEAAGLDPYTKQDISEKENVEQSGGKEKVAVDLS